ncbi:aminodeoxychorismate synthase component I [Rhodoluna limnophila]|uniref:aminodeoxychorismate synthase component I n=1 Tax=Rhodoluna limnophila TaxID=232537 RepID=UPI00110606E8|nr:aminodeoxychorismate synthase component I [Rhodoluna limnophila]
MQLYSAHLAGWAAPADVFAQFYSSEPNAFWLDREHHIDEPFSVMGAGTPEIFSIDGVASIGRVVGNPQIAVAGDAVGDLSLPFSWRPGLVGCLNYELDSLHAFISVDRAIIFDHRDKSMYFVGLFESQKAFSAWHRAALLRLTLVGGQQSIYRNRFRADQVTFFAQLRHSPSQYLGMIDSAQRHIEAGDVYQICLTNQVTLSSTADPLFTFLALREQNPAPYSAYLRFGDKAVVSSSPEQFLKLDASGHLSTKPIKGTRGRGADDLTDATIAAELKSNVKERAENLMIVDLMRNDLSKVAEIDSVRVPALFEVETYATVHQLVSTVTAQLKDDLDISAVLASAFPGGSMTGAPKIRAMEIISDLESGPRGVYSGALGYIGVDGSAEFGMTIRTLIFESGQVSLGVGGGITSDSDPDAELAETELKAQALLKVLNAPNPWS